jgi:regulator of sigma E protease
MSEKPSASMKNSSRMILLIAVVLAAGVFIVRNIEATKNVFLVLLGFGSFILVHEFGHFIVAKACGIKVEAFSIFMPPILLGIKKADRGWRIRLLPEMFRGEGENADEGQFSFTVGKKILPGETEYRIGLIPFGGFVKMLGQEDTGPAKANDDPRSFANKPALARAAVLAAG